MPGGRNQRDRVDKSKIFEFIEGDIAIPDVAGDALDRIDVVFHQAALASVPRSIEAPLETNHACITGTLNLLDQARRAGVKRFIYAASSSAYGDLPVSSKRESDLPSPMSPYAVAKLAGEHYCRAYYHTFGLETVAVRYFNVFGPRQDPNSPYSAVIPVFITAIMSGQRPIIYGDGLQSRDFTYVENVVKGNLLAADAPRVGGHTVNIANGRSTCLIDLLRHLNLILGTNVEPIHTKPRLGDVRHSMADISCARKLLGYEPEIDLETGLQRSIDYYRSQFGAPIKRGA